MEEDAAPFDLESLVGSYSGHNRINRLVYLADKRQGQPIELDALRLAHDEVKQTENTSLYQNIVERIAGRLGPAYSLDRQWVANVERSATAKHERLESDLAGAKANLIKESIRMGHMEIGDHLYARGDLQTAFKCYIRARDYCTNSKHIVAMCLATIRVALELGNYLHVGNYVSKAEQTGEADPVVVAKLAAAHGLSLLASKRYKQAASKLLEVTSDLGSHFNDVLAMQDVALYAALCALATFDRDELQRRLIKNIAFKELLDTVPEVRDVVQHFHGCRYAQALSALTNLAPSFALDSHLEGHAHTLMQQIRQRALVQYTSPFISVRLSSMAQSFNTTAGELGKELSTLIMDGAIVARIDAHAGVLHARQADVRATTFAKALATSQQYIQETKAALLRVDILKHDFLQKPRGGNRLGPAAFDGPGLDPRGLMGGFGDHHPRLRGSRVMGGGVGVGGMLMGPMPGGGRDDREEEDEFGMYGGMGPSAPYGGRDREGRSSGRTASK